MLKLIKRLFHIHKWRYTSVSEITDWITRRDGKDIIDCMPVYVYSQERLCPKCDSWEYRVRYSTGKWSEWVDSYKF